MKNKKLSYEIKGSDLIIGIDPNQDGQNVLTMKISLTEALGEAMSRGDAVEGVSAVKMSFSGSIMKIVIDTDKDGENLMELELDLAEAFDEVTSAFKKDDSESE